jgi:hypothetical protein
MGLPAEIRGTEDQSSLEETLTKPLDKVGALAFALFVRR